MKYNIGSVVLLDNNKTVYIAACNEKNKTYSGYAVEQGDSEEIIEFPETSVIMAI